MNKITAIILAAGKGERMKIGYNKIFCKIKKPIITHTIEAFENNKHISNIIVAANKNEIGLIKKLIAKYNFKKITTVIAGGKTRQESCYNAVMSIKKTGIVLIHDGARPFINQNIITESIKNAKKYGVCVVGVPVKDTIKLVKNNNFVDKTLDRSKLYSIQTPQVFK